MKTRADQEILREAFVARGFDCVLADPREMDVAGGRLHAGGAPVDLVYRRAVLSELVEREDEVRAFLGAYRHRLCPFVNSFRCRLSEDKAFFAILTDEAFAHLLSEDERALVAAVLPWTRRVAERRTLQGRPGGRPRAVRGREPGAAGAQADPRVRRAARSSWARRRAPGAWEAAVRAALDAPWVVQERVAIPEEPFPVFEGGALDFGA